MKSKVFIFAFIILLCFGGRPVSAQSDIPRPSIDTDLWQLRNTVIPDFRYHYDDYLQYAPAAVMVGMKAWIFREKHLYDGYEKQCFFYDPSVKHYNAELIFGRRFIIGASGTLYPVRGGLAGVSVDIPLVPGLGLTGRASANSLTYSDSTVGCLYSAMAGGFYNLHFAKILELQVKAMAGYAWSPAITAGGSTGPIAYCAGAGASLGAGFSLSMITGNNFRIKAFAELESIDLQTSGVGSSGGGGVGSGVGVPIGKQPWLNTVIVGFGTGWFW